MSPTNIEKVRQIKEKQVSPLLSAALIVLLVLVLALLALLIFDHCRISLRLKGEAECSVEFGSEFQDPGTEIVFSGDHFDIPLGHRKAPAEAAVDTRVLGSWLIRYSPGFLWFAGSCTRTVNVVDTTAPVITLQQVSGSYTLPGLPYEEEGYSAWDEADGDLTALVQHWEEGGVVYYRVADDSGNVGQAERQIFYDDPIPPVISLIGGERYSHPCGTAYREPGATVWDNLDGDITDRLRIEGSVDTEQPGEYELRYFAEDSTGNRAEAVRIVVVEPKPAGVVYLTFDDGPSKYTQDLLDILAKYDVKVTFFVVNYGYNDVIGKEYAAGHSVGVHSATHDYHTIYASEEAYFEDLQAMNDIIFAQTGVYADMVRFPGGSSNTISSFNPGIMTRLAEAVVERGYQYFDWNVASGDAGETTDPDVVYQNVIDGIRQHETSIVLMHDSKSYTVEAIERILLWCLENNYDLRPLTKDGPASHHRINN